MRQLVSLDVGAAPDLRATSVDREGGRWESFLPHETMNALPCVDPTGNQVGLSEIHDATFCRAGWRGLCQAGSLTAALTLVNA